MRVKLRIGVCSVLVLWAGLAFAKLSPDPVALQRAQADPRGWLGLVVTSVHRPTVSEIVSILENCERCVEALSRQAADKHVYNQFEQIIKKELPGVIGMLEAFYPNGLYATLGRDAFLIADLLEAFYLGIGSDGRVKRLGASSPTFLHFQSDQQILEFLKSYGIDPFDTTPVAIIDRTSYGHSSQSTRLIRALLSAHDRESAMTMALRVGVVSSNSGTALQGSQSEVERWKRVVSRRNQWLHSHEVPPHLNAAGMLNLTDAGVLNWHDSFGSVLGRNPRGEIQGVPQNGRESLDDRAATLMFFWNAYQELKNPEFQDLVINHLQSLGIEANARWTLAMRQKSERPTDPLRLLVERDLPSVLRESVTDTMTARVEQLIEHRLQRWGSKLNAKSSRSHRRRMEIYRTQRKKLNELRESIKTDSFLTTLLRESAFDFPKVNSLTVANSASQYFSVNARNLVETLDLWKHSVGFTAAELTQVFRLIGELTSLRVLVPKDRYRLLIYVFAHWPQIERSDLIRLGNVINQSTSLKRLIVNKAEFFLSNQAVRSKEIYVQLVDMGYLPPYQPCSAALLGGRDE